STRLFISNVADDADGLAAGSFDLAHYAVGLRFVRAHIDNNRSAGVRKRKRDGPANIAAGAGDDGNFACEFLVLSHDPRLSSQERQIDFALVKLCQLFECGSGAFIIPTAVANIARKLLFDVGPRERLVGTATEIRLPFLDHTSIVEHCADVPGEIA